MIHVEIYHWTTELVAIMEHVVRHVKGPFKTFFFFFNIESSYLVNQILKHFFFFNLSHLNNICIVKIMQHLI